MAICVIDEWAFDSDNRKHANGFDSLISEYLIRFCSVSNWLRRTKSTITILLMSCCGAILYFANDVMYSISTFPTYGASPMFEKIFTNKSFWSMRTRGGDCDCFVVCLAVDGCAVWFCSSVDTQLLEMACYTCL